MWSRHYYGADIWSKPPSDLHISFIYLGCQLTTAFCCQALLDGNSGWVQFAAEDKQVLTWRYFHETPFPNGFDEPVPRKQDRLYDTSISKRMDDPYWSVSPPPHHFPSSVSGRIVDITPRLCIQHASPGKVVHAMFKWSNAASKCRVDQKVASCLFLWHSVIYMPLLSPIIMAPHVPHS